MINIRGWLILTVGAGCLVWKLPAAELPSADQAVLPDAAKLALFQFGTPNSALRAGFTRVTVEEYTPQKGYGFKTTQGLLAFDRGGSEVALPKDEYTARVYGAYRTTSDLTSALIEGTTNNAFEISLPSGEYTAWVIASDAEWDPPFYEVWANNQKKLEVRIPRAKFVFLEPFHARSVNGRFRIEFHGPHGWVLNGLVIGKEGPELSRTIANLRRDIFFLTEKELPGWKEVKPVPTNPPLDWTMAESQQGYVVFPVDYTEQIAPTYLPSRRVIGEPLTAFAASGELEPATFCISSRRELGRVTVELSDFIQDGTKQVIGKENVRVGTVRCSPKRDSSWGAKGEYHSVPDMIEAPDGHNSEVVTGQVKQWWLTVRVPPGVAPGRYRMRMTVRPEKAPATSLEWRLLVLPFSLTRPPDKHWGTWLESFPPVGGLRGPERRGRNTPTEMDRLVRADLADYHDHGFDVAIFNYYFGVKEKADGTFSYDISDLSRDLEYWKTLGSDTPVVIGCEYTFRNLEYGLAEPDQTHVPGTFSPKARQAILGLVRYIHGEAERHQWPKIYFFPIDEPGNNKTENRMRFAENVLDLIHEVPGCQTATTVGASDLQRLGDRVDVRIYAFGNYNRHKVLQDVRDGHPFWFYENGMFYGHSTIGSRNMAGFEFLRSGAEVATAWGFDCTQDNPHNDFDGGHRDWNVVYPGSDTLTPTVYWELCREGVDDCRYVATLQDQIRLAKQHGKMRVARRAERVLGPLLDPDAHGIETPFAFSRYRWRIAREILNLMGNRENTLSFPACVSNAVASEKPGPNILIDPSFEDGPQTDGFPSLSYAIADRYSKSEQKPIEALSVTDKVAHSGRFSLKWDFSKALGKGVIYDGKHYLIVNVQIPADSARSLQGKRIKVGYWLRLEGGAAVPGLTLRESGKNQFLEGISYTGGVDDPAVWNHFEAEGRLRTDFENLDIHISCPVPDDSAVAAKSAFFIDDVSLQAIEEPPTEIHTALDEYYIGERVPWELRATTASSHTVQLLRGKQVVSERKASVRNGTSAGEFETAKLKPGIYTLRAMDEMERNKPSAALQEIILTPNPFDWPAMSR